VVWEKKPKLKGTSETRKLRIRIGSRQTADLRCARLDRGSATKYTAITEQNELYSTYRRKWLSLYNGRNKGFKFYIVIFVWLLMMRAVRILRLVTIKYARYFEFEIDVHFDIARISSYGFI